MSNLALDIFTGYSNLRCMWVSDAYVCHNKSDCGAGSHVCMMFSCGLLLVPFSVLAVICRVCYLDSVHMRSRTGWEQVKNILSSGKLVRQPVVDQPVKWRGQTRTRSHCCGQYVWSGSLQCGVFRNNCMPSHVFVTSKVPFHVEGVWANSLRSVVM